MKNQIKRLSTILEDVKNFKYNKVSKLIINFEKHLIKLKGEETNRKMLNLLKKECDDVVNLFEEVDKQGINLK